MRTTFIAILLTGFLASSLAVSAEDATAPPARKKTAPPKTAKSRDTILAALEKTKGFGTIQWTESSRWEGRVLVAWHCPFSGRAAVFTRAYYHDGKQWHLFFDRMIKGTHDLSVELPANQNVLKFRGADGAVVHVEPLDKIPGFNK